MNRQRREDALLLFFAGLLALTLLAGSLDRLTLRSAVPNDPRFLGELLAFRQLLLSPRTLVLMLTCFVPFLLITAYLILVSASERRRQQQRRSLLLEIFLWMLAFASLRFFVDSGLFGRQNGGNGVDPGLQLPDVPEINFVPQVSSTASLFTGLLLILLLIFGAWMLWRRLHPAPILVEQIGSQAEAALEELRSGADFKNTILRCYAEMCRVLNQQRGLQRDRGMTPREFEVRLWEAGLPAGPVSKLTRLFERVRYGANQPQPHEEREAYACLEDIAAASGKLE